MRLPAFQATAPSGQVTGPFASRTDRYARAVNGPVQAQSPSWDDVTKSAEAAAAELRAQITLQTADANSLDTKVSALVTAEVAIAGLVVARIHLDTPERVAAGVLAFVVLLLVAYPAAQTLRPRDGFSFGAEAEPLVDSLSRYPRAGVALALAQSLAYARNKNVVALGVKQRWYEIALFALLALVPALALMVAVGAIQ